jgi:hypothetical protein
MRLVNPNEARKGTFLEVFRIREEEEMLAFCARMEELLVIMKDSELEIVYTKIPAWGKSRGGDTWQVYVLRKED